MASDQPCLQKPCRHRLFRGLECFSDYLQGLHVLQPSPNPPPIHPKTPLNKANGLGNVWRSDLRRRCGSTFLHPSMNAAAKLEQFQFLRLFFFGDVYSFFHCIVLYWLRPTLSTISSDQFVSIHPIAGKPRPLFFRDLIARSRSTVFISFSPFSRLL